jgi:hypothetical protein
MSIFDKIKKGVEHVANEVSEGVTDAVKDTVNTVNDVQKDVIKTAQEAAEDIIKRAYEEQKQIIKEARETTVAIGTNELYDIIIKAFEKGNPVMQIIGMVLKSFKKQILEEIRNELK